MKKVLLWCSACLLLLPASSAAAASSPTVVLYYGDSLAREAQNYFVAELAARSDVSVVAHSFPGMAPCDFYDQMLRDNQRYPGALVVSSFYGNLLTKCIKNVYRGDWEKTYTTQVRAIATKLPGATRLWMALPPIAPATGSKRQTSNWRVLQAAAAADGRVQPFDAGAVVENADGSYAGSLPCLSGEPCLGVPTPGYNRVRSYDNLHFCPGTHTAFFLYCSQYDSGAWRYGKALAAPVLTYLAAR